MDISRVCGIERDQFRNASNGGCQRIAESVERAEAAALRELGVKSGGR